MCSIIYLLCSLIIIRVDSAKILCLYPSPSLSHHFVFRPFTEELLGRGHEVTVITPRPMYEDEKAPENLTEIDTKALTLKLASMHYKQHGLGRRKYLYDHAKVGLDFLYLINPKEILRSKEVKDLFKSNQTFDVIILESYCRIAFALSEVYKAAIILISSFYTLGSYEILGAPVNSIYQPSYYPHKIFNMTVTETIRNVITDKWVEYLYSEFGVKENAAMKEVFPAVPNIEELSNNVNLLMVNVHPIWEGNRPVPLRVVYLGGMHQKPEEELPKDLKSYLDSSNGVIYVSFGTNMQSRNFSQETIQVLVKVFSELPYNVLWKWDLKELPGQSKNIRVSKWFPQADLLRHPKVKLFITQGGLQSTDEAITAGVPLLGIPIIFDQWCNVDKYVYHKIGLKLELSELNEDSLRNAVHTLVNDESYRDAVVRLRGLMLDQPQRPLQRAVWWTEHVLRHGGAPHLRAPAANITWTEYLELELVLIVLFCCSITLSIIMLVMYVLAKFVMKLIK